MTSLVHTVSLLLCVATLACDSALSRDAPATNRTPVATSPVSTPPGASTTRADSHAVKDPLLAPTTTAEPPNERVLETHPATTVGVVASSSTSALTAPSAPPSAANAPYRALTPPPPKAIPYAEGSLGAEFQRAREATTLNEAESRWSNLLDRFAPTDGEYEDGFHAHHVRAARIELARVHYLQGLGEKADALLRTVLSEP